VSEELERVLELVAKGRLTPEEAAPIIEALTRAWRGPASDPIAAARAKVEEARDRVDGIRRTFADAGAGRLRIRVTERGRQVVNLNIPLGFVDAALGGVPGLSEEQSDGIRQAIRGGHIGPIIDVEDEDGDSVLISVE
jgi:polyhydroxyalkanoate synthesis regulator phasin